VLEIRTAATLDALVTSRVLKNTLAARPLA
jgi:hypothetical protein